LPRLRFPLLLAHLFGRPAHSREDLLTGPIRGELLGADHLADRARSMARGQQLAPASARPRATPLLTRVTETRRIVRDARDRLSAASAEVDIGPAGEWLLDNYYVVEEHIREVKESLPRGYYRELPVLASGPLAGYPRVYELATTLISHTEGRVDIDNVELFTGAAQEVTPLNLGELWAIPASLRLGLIENIRRMALRTVQRLTEIELADQHATRIQVASEAGPAALRTAVDAFLASAPPLTAIFVARLRTRLREAGASQPPLVWLGQWLSEEGLGAEEAAGHADQKLALTQVIMANSISSLRAIGRMDWQGFVEHQSQIEAILRQDPVGQYAAMTFATRDWYRHVVERMARGTRRQEPAVAQQAIDLAREAAARGAGRQAHVGYYLIDGGVDQLAREVGYRPGLREWLVRLVRRHPNATFIGGIGVGLAVAILVAFVLAGAAARDAIPLVLAVILLPALDIAINGFNQLVTAFLPPRLLPKLEFRDHDSIPGEFRTLVVLPILVDRVSSAHAALENLETQYLANRAGRLHFGLLTDFTDAATPTTADDGAILAALVNGITELNRRYADDTSDAFYLFHRSRRWNATQQSWMGWERKRGKLAELNRYLRGHDQDAFSTVVGNTAALTGVRFVITLDSDTVLPSGGAALLIGALGHPLNRATFDPARRIVTEGYGILQPRVGVSLPSAFRSRFSAVRSGHPGVDPYTTAVSDVYQDLFGEGSFTGKGIYDIDVFEQATQGRFPENTLLSHDLIEGSYARAGLVTDITVYDDFPSRYLSYTRRKHRWIRGDWQLLRWLGRHTPGPDGIERNRLSLLSRWKLLDNLRRSTVEISQVILLVAGWTILPGDPVRWTALGLGAIGAPWVISLLLAALRPPRDKSWRAYYVTVGHDAVTGARQAGLALITLPHQALVALDGIIRTLWRLTVSHRRLLEWQTASQVEQASATDPRGYRPLIAVAWLVPGALALAALVLLLQHGPLPGRLVLSASPVIILWFLAPAMVRVLDGPVLAPRESLKQSSRATALRYALLHWRYFDRFVTESTHWLAPDNYQEQPLPQLALRTSPTNIGLQLLSTVSACDLGFLPLADTVRRMELTFATLDRLARFRGHFYNWYSLTDLQVLTPGYVSTVDSGNLAGHLIALRQACLELSQRPARPQPPATILHAVTRILLDALKDTKPEGRDTVLSPRIEGLRGLHQQLGRAPTGSASDLFRSVELELTALQAVVGTPEDGGEEVQHWIGWGLRFLETQRLMPAPPPRDQAQYSGGSPSVSADLALRLEQLAERAYRFALEMEFGFLYDRQRKLLTIGYHPGSHTPDASFYDLLASESRLASFLAIAEGAIPVEHWFRLGRPLTQAAGETLLVSWSGSMFEYLMPNLVLRSFPQTVLDQTSAAVVRRQISYATERSVPWGVSESAYNLLDRHGTYQYRAFGVPDIALKRGLSRDLVVAPYASVLALGIEPAAGIRNLAFIEQLGGLGPFGFRDAFDYTRPDPGARFAVVHNYMAHHVGMSLVALTNLLTRDRWPRRFHADALVRSAELLLHERLPRRLTLREPPEIRPEEALPDPDLARPAVREYDMADVALPHIALLGRLPYTLMISHAGGGYSRYGDLATTRWRADGTVDGTGQFIYLKDVTSGRTWSAAHQPLCTPADASRARLATDRVTFERRDGPIETRTEIVVVPVDAAEVRRVTVTNHGNQPCEIELTSYGEVVLAPPESERAHPAFANLFVETEWHSWCSAITAARRPRSALEQMLWCVHLADASPLAVGPPSCETDRARFLGRGRTPRNPVILEQDGDLSGTVGAVLDPVFAIRVRLRLEPGQSGSVAFTTLVTTSREQAFELADRYHDPRAAQRALDLAWAMTQVELRELGLASTETALYQELVGALFYGGSPLGPSPERRQANRGGQPLLWSLGLSGDWPILLATIDSVDGLATLRQLFSAHHYWRRRGMMVDLVVLNRRQTTYYQDLHDRIMETWIGSNDADAGERPGGVFIRRADAVPADELLMLEATARVHVACDGRTLARVIETPVTTIPRGAEPAGALDLPATLGRVVSNLRNRRRDDGAAVRPAEAPPASPSNSRILPRPPMLLDNGNGGLRPDGSYFIEVRDSHLPPAPWVNVIANPHGGVVTSERGTGFCWAGNSYFYRLTAWHNDPVSDPPGDVLYLQDEVTGTVWSATPAPCRDPEPWAVEHAAGQSTYQQTRDSLTSRLTIGLAPDAAVKLSTLQLTNHGPEDRTLLVTQYVEWTLGVSREHTQHQVDTTYDAERSAILARNSFNPLFAEWVAFTAVSHPLVRHTASRRDFLGRNGTLARPRGLSKDAAWGAPGNGNDPCAALQCRVMIPAGTTVELTAILGAAASEQESLQLLDRYRTPAAASAAMERTRREWSDRLAVVTVATPDPAFDAMINHWGLYQALSCRMWARSALYQSGGAYGFRDQLQDVLAFVYAEPAIARAHILRAASRQFLEGDVQHWWHPQTGRGVRTRFSDDLAWLPFVVEQYQRVTGDREILDLPLPFLTMRPLEPHEHEIYDLPEITGETGSLYEHCRRALVRAATIGPHGLPLIGSGDWNDGMNRVGIEGRGESIWLGWFLVSTLRSFAALAQERSDPATATDFRARADAYVEAIEAHGWDGEWYRRGYFDDGTPLGSATSMECRIDSIAQSWSVISEAGEPARQAQAMASLVRHLVHEDDRLIALLQPPFDESAHDPGYIRGYLPGVRENGAQYTHAALWAVLAMARMGNREEAFRLFQMINPLTHARTPSEVDRYKVEPYVVAADVYTAPGQIGRGGWTWYTGSASWMYRIGLESILGFRKEGRRLFIEPCVPADWPGYQITYRYGRSTYTIAVEQAKPDGVPRLLVDGVVQRDGFVALVDDGKTRMVLVER
jgi:cellobiose phosphorylase